LKDAPSPGATLAPTPLASTTTTSLGTSCLSPGPVPPGQLAADESTTRDEVQSPAYSDISDPNDSGANDSHGEVGGGKPGSKSNDDRSKSPTARDGASPPQPMPYPGFPFYGGPLPYPVSSVASMLRPPVSVGSSVRPKDSQAPPSMVRVENSLRKMKQTSNHLVLDNPQFFDHLSRDMLW
jgi:hypothetical protein